MISHEIIDIMADVVKATSKDCRLVLPDYQGGFRMVDCPEINYTFGNARYVKESLDELSLTTGLNKVKFPLIALFSPFNEKRDSPDYHSKAKVRMIIACSTFQQWSNEQRKVYSFENQLRPVYERFMKCLKADRRLDFGYKGHVPHEYSENYSYGRYGAYTEAGDEVSEPIDAINITNLELTVKNINCRHK